MSSFGGNPFGGDLALLSQTLMVAHAGLYSMLSGFSNKIDQIDVKAKYLSGSVYSEFIIYAYNKHTRRTVFQVCSPLGYHCNWSCLARLQFYPYLQCVYRHSIEFHLQSGSDGQPNQLEHFDHGAVVIWLIVHFAITRISPSCSPPLPSMIGNFQSDWMRLCVNCTVRHIVSHRRH